PELKGMTPDERQKFLMAPERNKDFMSITRNLMSDPTVLQAFIPRIAESLHIPANFNFAKVDLKKLVQEDTTRDPMTHAPIVEEIATEYADYFMGKYFAEAPRIVYMRAHNLPPEAQQPPEVYPFHCGSPYIKLHYRNVEPDMLSQLPQAFPESCQAVLK